MLRRLMAISCLLTLSACAYWPPEGQGGQAESFKTAPAYLNALRQSNKKRIECFDLVLQNLSASPVGERHPAKLSELSIDWTRALRAHAGHLDIEAQNDLVTLDEKFKSFEKTLRRDSHFQLVSNSAFTTAKEICK